MADTGWLDLTVFADDDFLGIGSAWANAGNAATSDDTYATSTVPADGNSNTLRANSLSGSVPGGATIDGIEVRVEARGANTRNDISEVGLTFDAGATPEGTVKTPATAIDDIDTYYVFGGPTDLWGASPADTDVNGSGFGFGVRFNSTDVEDSDLFVDHMQMRVHYTGGAVTVHPTGIASEEAFGTPSVSVVEPPTVHPAGIPSEEAFGAPSVSIITPAEPIIEVLDPGVNYVVQARSSDDLSVQFHITDADSISFGHRLYELAEFEIPDIEMDAAVAAWAEDEGIVAVVRNGVVEFAGIVDDYDFDDHTGIGTLRGVDARSLLSWRDVYPPDGEETADQEDTVTQVIRNYILDNLTTGAIADRNFNNETAAGTDLVIENVSLGPAKKRQERYSNLLDLAFELAAEGDVFFVPTIVGDDYQITFDEYADKADSVRFALGLGTALSIKVKSSRRGFVNAVRVLGDRHNGDQTIYDEDDVGTLSPYRREQVVDAGEVHTVATLSLADRDTWWTGWSEYEETNETDHPGPDGWTRRWDEAAQTVNVVKPGPSGSTDGAVLRMLERSPTDEGRFALSSDLIGIVTTPVEIYTKAQFTAAEFNVVIAALHSGGSGNLNEDTYMLALHGDPDLTGLDWSLGKLLIGQGAGLINEEAQALSENTWYRMRMRREGRFVRVKVWEDGDPEPSAWQEVEDNSHDSGWMGIGRWGAGAGRTYFDWVGFGLNGATAPDSFDPQTVTIGAQVYTFAQDMDTADNVLFEMTAEHMVRNLAAAINGDAGEGELYGTGTLAHPDVTAVADGDNLVIVSEGDTEIALASDLDNGEWDRSELGDITNLAAGVLADHANQVRTYEVIPNPVAVPYRSSVELGDLVTVVSERLNESQIKVVAGVDVEWTQAEGEKVMLHLGAVPYSVLNRIYEHGVQIRTLKVSTSRGGR